MHLAKLAIVVGSLTLTGALVFSLPSCGNQGEGERCDRANGDADCDDGLICKSKKDLGTSSDICCPPDLAQTTDLACLGGLADAGTGGGGTDGGGTGGGGTGGIATGVGGTGGSGTAGTGGTGGTGGSGTAGTGGTGGAAGGAGGGGGS